MGVVISPTLVTVFVLSRRRGSLSSQLGFSLTCSQAESTSCPAAATSMTKPEKRPSPNPSQDAAGVSKRHKHDDSGGTAAFASNVTRVSQSSIPVIDLTGDDEDDFDNSYGRNEPAARTGARTEDTEPPGQVGHSVASRYSISDGTYPSPIKLDLTDGAMDIDSPSRTTTTDEKKLEMRGQSSTLTSEDERDQACPSSDAAVNPFNETKSSHEQLHTCHLQIPHPYMRSAYEEKAQYHRTKDTRDLQQRPQTRQEAAYDTCFGLLLIEATSARGVELPTECTPAKLSLEDTAVRVYTEDSSTRVAIIASDALPSLARDFSIILTATICGKKSKPIVVHGSRSKAGRRNPRTCPARVVVYGNFDEKDAVADALASHDLFLQHPGEAEFDRSVRYFNPQYFLLPGKDMPPIETLNVVKCCEARAGSNMRVSLGEVEKAQVLRIFDSAYNTDADPVDTITPSLRLRTRLQRHQLQALAMMVEKERATAAGVDAKFPSLWEPVKSQGLIRYQHIVTRKLEVSPPPPLCGGVLADEMGLGKTLSCLAFICHSLDEANKHPEPAQRQLRKATLVVTPKSTIYNWEKQIESHILPGEVHCLTYYGSKRHELPSDITSYDIVLTTYETVRSDYIGKGPVFGTEWARVILDEAHKIRNRASRIFETVSKISAQNRWCLTGTPIQNCLDDYGALLAFIRVPPFTTKRMFDKLVSRPVKSRDPVALSMLRKLVAATCLRRTKTGHSFHFGLTKKTVLRHEVEMGKYDRRVYEFFKHCSFLLASHGRTGASNNGGSQRKKTSRAANVLVLIGLLRLICNHGEALLSSAALKVWKSRDVNIMNWDILESSVKLCGSCGCELEDQEASETMARVLSCGHAVCDGCASDSQRLGSSNSCTECGKLPKQNPGQYSSQVELESSSAKRHHQPSAKVEAILENLAKAHPAVGTGSEMAAQKSVVFSYWTKMLDLIAVALNDKKLAFERIDGQTTLAQRKQAIEKFNGDPTCNVMLASIGAAGEGIDLTAANFVHIVEPHWNPMAEAQAVDRVHRIGQQRDVTVFKYIVKDSVEFYVKWIQEDKLRLVEQSLSFSEQRAEDVEEGRWKELLEYLK